jgi:hypothetical protein
MAKVVQLRPEGPVGDHITVLKKGWELSLRARNRRPKTIKSYLEPLGLFQDFLCAEGLPTEVVRIERALVEAFVSDQWGVGVWVGHAKPKGRPSPRTGGRGHPSASYYE